MSVEFWNSRPCNIKHSNKEIGTLEYFEEVSARKYHVESHILEFAEFEKWSGKKVLEIGCGIGTDMISFLRHGAIYTGIDLSDNSISLAKKRSLVYNYDVSLYVADVSNLDLLKKLLKDNKYDLIYSFGVLHHVENINNAIKSCKYFLKENGVLKIMLYATNSWKNFKIQDGLDQFEAQYGVPIANTYTKKEVQDLLEDDFIDIDIYQTHIFPYKIEKYKNYEYEMEDYFKCMSADLFKCLEKNLGFHLCITAKYRIRH